MWHYKCIRPILNGATWPNFLCPNCRAVADLEADIEDPGEFEEWDDDVAQEAQAQANGEKPQADRHITPRSSTIPLNGNSAADQPPNGMTFDDLEAAISSINLADSLNGIANQPIANPSTPQRYIPPVASSSITQPVNINITGVDERSGLSPLYPASANAISPNGVPEGPLTPRNDAGPFVLDGSGGRTGTTRRDGDAPPTLPPLRMD